MSVRLESYRSRTCWVGCPSCGGPVDVTIDVQRAINDFITVLFGVTRRLDAKTLDEALGEISRWCNTYEVEDLQEHYLFHPLRDALKRVQEREDHIRSAKASRGKKAGRRARASRG